MGEDELDNEELKKDKKPKMSEKARNILEWIVCIVIAVVLTLLFRYFIATPTVVQQVSMYPTLVENQRLIVKRTFRITGSMPKRGDIVTFETTHIGIISDKRNSKGIPYLIHNTGQPFREEDVLELYGKNEQISGHYRMK